jgi:hypothetical protein
MTQPFRAASDTSVDLLCRIRGEFLEMPGLRLTEAQARRMWGLDPATCSSVLSTLIDARFLFRTRDGAFMCTEGARTARTLSRGAPKASTAA